MCGEPWTPFGKANDDDDVAAWAGVDKSLCLNPKFVHKQV